MINEVEYIETEAEKTHALVCSVTSALHKNFIDLAILLKVMRDKELYRDLDYESFEEYCSIPEIDLSRSQVFKLISVYERWIERYGHKESEIEDISIEKLYIASSQANDDNHDEWLEKARTLSRDDLKASTPGGKQRYTKVRCPKCGEEFDVTNDTKVN